MATSRVLHAPRALRPLGWALAVLFVAALFVQFTHAGIDIFLMLLAGFVLLVLERTLGDWIAETVGAPATALIFTPLAGMAVVYALSADGRAKANRVFAAAESRGYRPVYFVVAEPAESEEARKAARRIRDSATGLSADAAPATAEQSEQKPAASPPKDVPLSRGLLDWSSSGPDKTIRLRLRADPDVILTGQTVTLHATIESGVRREAMAALFTVNGNLAGRVAFDDAGHASTRFVADVPGMYTARLRVATGTIFAQEASASFNVLPGASLKTRRSR